MSFSGCPHRIRLPPHLDPIYMAAGLYDCAHRGIVRQICITGTASSSESGGSLLFYCCYCDFKWPVFSFPSRLQSPPLPFPTNLHLQRTHPSPLSPSLPAGPFPLPSLLRPSALYPPAPGSIHDHTLPAFQSHMTRRALRCEIPTFPHLFGLLRRTPGFEGTKQVFRDQKASESDVCNA
jgi:hypothetical protein